MVDRQRPISRRYPSGRPVFSLVIPPPNVTGSLHIGHLLDHTVMDVAVRWHRMRGDNTLWLPGTDHAGIATQMVVERELAKQNLTRVGLGREEFERRVWQWKENMAAASTFRSAVKAPVLTGPVNASPWIRVCRARSAKTFVRLWDTGLIYRGDYMVNWCPGCHTAISDVETVHEAIPGHLWHIRYPMRWQRRKRGAGDDQARDNAWRYRDCGPSGRQPLSST